MKTSTLLQEEQLVKKGVTALLEKLGPIESSRFLALPLTQKRIESVKRHRQWQKQLVKRKFFNQVFQGDKSP